MRRSNMHDTKAMNRFTALLLSLLMVLAFTAPFAKASNMEIDEDGGIWDYDAGLYTSPEGEVFPIENTDSGSSSGNSKSQGTDLGNKPAQGAPGDNSQANQGKTGKEEDEDGGIWDYDAGTYTSPEGEVYPIVNTDSGLSASSSREGSGEEKDAISDNDGIIVVEAVNGNVSVTNAEGEKKEISGNQVNENVQRLTVESKADEKGEAKDSSIVLNGNVYSESDIWMGVATVSSQDEKTASAEINGNVGAKSTISTDGVSVWASNVADVVASGDGADAEMTVGGIRAEAEGDREVNVSAAASVVSDGENSKASMEVKKSIEVEGNAKGQSEALVEVSATSVRASGEGAESSLIVHNDITANAIAEGEKDVSARSFALSTQSLAGGTVTVEVEGKAIATSSIGEVTPPNSDLLETAVFELSEGEGSSSDVVIGKGAEGKVVVSAGAGGKAVLEITEGGIKAEDNSVQINGSEDDYYNTEALVVDVTDDRQKADKATADVDINGDVLATMTKKEHEYQQTEETEGESRETGEGLKETTVPTEATAIRLINAGGVINVQVSGDVKAEGASESTGIKIESLAIESFEIDKKVDITRPENVEHWSTGIGEGIPVEVYVTKNPETGEEVYYGFDLITGEAYLLRKNEDKYIGESNITVLASEGVETATVSGDQVGLEADLAGDQTAKVIIDGTLSGGDYSVVLKNETSIGEEGLMLTVWEITPNKDDALVIREELPETGNKEPIYKQDREAEKNIQYIIKMDQPAAGGTLALDGTTQYEGFEVAKAGTKVILKVTVAEGYELTGAFNGKGEKTALLKDSDGNYYIEVPDGGGVYLTAELTKSKREENTADTGNTQSSGAQIIEIENVTADQMFSLGEVVSFGNYDLNGDGKLETLTWNILRMVGGYARLAMTTGLEEIPDDFRTAFTEEEYAAIRDGKITELYSGISYELFGDKLVHPSMYIKVEALGL